MKKVSVIITTYGGGDEIVRAVNSLLKQTYTDLEIIVVDDNGLGTPAQIKTQQLICGFIQNGTVKYVSHDINRNGSVARNTGFKNSVGEYVMFLDDDDEYTPDRIEKQLSVLESLDKSWGVSYCSYVKLTKNGRLFETVNVKKSGNILYNVVMHRGAPTTDNMMIRRECYEAVGGFDESFKRHQDWEFTARLASRYKFAAMRDVGLIVNMEFRNSPKSLELYKEYRLKYLKKIEPELNQLSGFFKKRVIAENLYDIAMQHLKSGGIRAFIAEYRTVKMGYFGIEFLFRRFYYILKQRLQLKFTGKN